MFFSQNRQHADDKRTEYIDQKRFDRESVGRSHRHQSDQIAQHGTDGSSKSHTQTFYHMNLPLHSADVFSQEESPFKFLPFLPIFLI